MHNLKTLGIELISIKLQLVTIELDLVLKVGGIWCVGFNVHDKLCHSSTNQWRPRVNARILVNLFFHIHPTLAALHSHSLLLQKNKYSEMDVYRGNDGNRHENDFPHIFSTLNWIAFLRAAMNGPQAGHSEILRKWHDNIILPQIEKLTSSRAYWQTDNPYDPPTQTTFDEWKGWFKI